VVTVCLEHGKKEPRPHIKYVIKPIEAFTDNPEVAQVCKMLGYGQIDQRAAQVAAWHFTDGMSWEQLARKEIRHLNGSRESYFHRAEIMRGMRIAQVAIAQAKEIQEQSPGEQAVAEQ
jgi:hypothetical protein